MKGQPHQVFDYFRVMGAFLVPFFMAVFFMPHFSRIASQLGFTDKPNQRKVHDDPRPLVGGLGMALAVSFAGLLFIPLENLRGFYAGTVMLVVVGFLDDFQELHHRVKFGAQIVACLLIAFFSNARLKTFGDLLALGPIDFGPFAIPMTVIGVVGVINAINMMDGMDGLAGGISLSAFAAFAFLGYLSRDPVLTMLCLAFCGAVTAFLHFNWNPAKLFMGDAGSLFLGFAAGFVSIAITQQPDSVVRPVVPLLILAVPISDTLVVMTRRVIRGRSPFYPDRTHLHHLLMKLRFGPQQTVLVIIGLSGFMGAVGVAGTIYKIPEYFLFFFFLAYFCVHVAFHFTYRRLLSASEDEISTAK